MSKCSKGAHQQLVLVPFLKGCLGPLNANIHPCVTNGIACFQRIMATFDQEEKLNAVLRYLDYNGLWLFTGNLR